MLINKAQVYTGRHCFLSQEVPLTPTGELESRDAPASQTEPAAIPTVALDKAGDTNFAGNVQREQAAKPTCPAPRTALGTPTTGDSMKAGATALDQPY